MICRLANANRPAVPPKTYSTKCREHRTENRRGECMTRSADKPVLLVTGASPGIGDAIARRFAHGGFRIVAVARRAERLAQLAKELAECTEVETLAVDVTTTGASTRAVEL